MCIYIHTGTYKLQLLTYVHTYIHTETQSIVPCKSLVCKRERERLAKGLLRCVGAVEKAIWVLV